jgi:hypothetical protein
VSVEYHEPSQPGGGPGTVFRRKHLGVFVDDPGVNLEDPVVVESLVLAFLVDQYELPHDHWAVHAALASIKEKR